MNQEEYLKIVDHIEGAIHLLMDLRDELRQSRPSIKTIPEIVALYSDPTFEEVWKRADPIHAVVRRKAWKMMRENGYTYRSIAEATNFSESTIMKACRK